MARSRSTKTGRTAKNDEPAYSYVVGPDGVPIVRPPDGSNLDSSHRWTCPCPLCLADASLGLDKRGCYFVWCGRCNQRMFTNSALSGQMIRAWLRIHRMTPQALSPLRALLGAALAQIQQEDAEASAKNST